METIKNYLENMFKTLPRNEDILRLKNELLCNMEEKYQELKSAGKTENEAIGIVISEFGNIDELLSEMGLNVEGDEKKYPVVTIEEAEDYILEKKKASVLVGVGVVLCILGALVLILLSTLIEANMIFEGLPSNAKEILPLICLFLLVVPAVVLFILSGMKLERYKYIEEGMFSLTLSSQTILAQKREATVYSNKIAIIIGVSLCVISPMAIFIGYMFGERGSIYGVCVLLLIVAIAVYIFISFGSIEEAYKKLIKIGEYSPSQKKNNKVIGAVAGVVWPIATCIFLLWGFIFHGWNICWIVFPITGVLFGAFATIYNSITAEA